MDKGKSYEKETNEKETKSGQGKVPRLQVNHVAQCMFYDTMNGLQMKKSRLIHCIALYIYAIFLAFFLLLCFMHSSQPVGFTVLRPVSLRSSYLL